MNTPDYIKEFREKFVVKLSEDLHGGCICGKCDPIDFLGGNSKDLESFLTAKIAEAEIKGINKAVEYILQDPDILALEKERIISVIEKDGNLLK